MELNQEIQRIARLKESEVGSTEENVKQKIIVPLLEILGHMREDLSFEHRTKSGGKIDIFITNVPSDCKVIIDTKNYAVNLAEHVDQIRDYAFDESALLAILANGTEIRIYSSLRGIAFERSLLYSIKREDLSKEGTWIILSNLLSKEKIKNKTVLQVIEQREKEIKQTLADEEHLKEEYSATLEKIGADIDSKEEEIRGLRAKKDELETEITENIADLWDKIGLPLELFSFPRAQFHGPDDDQYILQKARRVRLQELVDGGLVKDGQVLYFYNTRTFNDEQALVVASSNKLKYKSDGRVYSVSELAKILLKKLGFKKDEHGVAGPKYWKTKEGKLLNDLNEQVRQKRGDRS
jgi:predicted type IV restriction endonuclease